MFKFSSLPFISIFLSCTLVHYSFGIAFSQNYSDYQCRDDWMTKELSLEWVKRCIEYEERDINEKYLSDTSTVGLNGNTVLHEAVERNKLDIIVYLLKKGAKVNSKNAFEGEPIHIAALWNRIEAMKILIRSGSNVNALDNINYTPLMSATYNNSTGALRL